MIKRHNENWQLAPSPSLQWHERGPRSQQFDDIYFSLNDGVAESRYVFLEGVALTARIAVMRPGASLVIAETGFGTGLNFLLTLESWLANRKPTTTLHYIGIDAYPLRRQDLERACALHPDLVDLASTLIADWPAPTRGCHRIRWPHWGLTLDLWWEDAEQTLADLQSHGQAWIDCWYLDGFAPARNAALWSDGVFQSMATLSRDGARFATFTAASAVRRGLTEAGFTVDKRKGFGYKREALHGQLAEPKVRGYDHTPWDIPVVTSSPTTALVIGAGLAGCFAARSLAERGVHVTVLERRTVACGGSGNLQGLTYTRLSHRYAPLADFSLTAFDYATRLYQRLLRERSLLEGTDAGSTGFLQVGMDDMTLARWRTVLASGEALAEALDAEGASARLGIAIDHGGLHFPNALWLNPTAVCHERLRHPLIHVETNCGDVTLEKTANDWLARSENGKGWQAEVAILATAAGLRNSTYTHWLPLQVIRGQVSHVPATPVSTMLRTALCHEGYLPPARAGVHCLGASYGPNDEALDERTDEHTHNLQLLGKWLGDLHFPASGDAVQGHVAQRCTSADYLPVIGPVPDREAFNRVYAPLGKRKSALVTDPSPMVPGLWTLAALGSRGLTTAALGAEIIGGAILGEPCPVPRYIHQAVAPARFLHRAIIRGAPLSL